jgi:hypothetical protein
MMTARVFGLAVLFWAITTALWLGVVVEFDMSIGPSFIGGVVFGTISAQFGMWLGFRREWSKR